MPCIYPLPRAVSLLASKWAESTGHQMTKNVFQVPYDSPVFRQKYDELQDQLEALAAMDDLLTGTIVIFAWSTPQVHTTLLKGCGYLLV